jgi:hypothetical protein
MKPLGSPFGVKRSVLGWLHRLDSPIYVWKLPTVITEDKGNLLALSRRIFELGMLQPQRAQWLLGPLPRTVGLSSGRNPMIRSVCKLGPIAAIVAGLLAASAFGVG